MDSVDKATRSRMMSGIRSRDTQPEMTVRCYLHARGLSYRLHVRQLPGTPDLVLPKYHTVVFVHGCFWHRHAGCRDAVMPKSNTAFWQEKLDGNVRRDAKNLQLLKALGWRVLVVWECEMAPARLARLAAQIRRGQPRAGPDLSR